MLTQYEQQWLDRMKRTMAIDVSRYMQAGWRPQDIIDRLFEIPEVEEAFYLRAKAVRDLSGKWRLGE
jgi:hypothetical protein